MHRSQKSLKPSPSIRDIIIEDQEAKQNNQIKQYFRSQIFPIFPLPELLSLPEYTTDQRFYCLVRELQDWNCRVESASIPPDSRAELYRNKFIYTQLKNLVYCGAKTGQTYETNLNKLYQWWRKNSKQQIPMFLTTRKGQNQDDEWQVRKTFKSNMPLELKNYERRVLFASQENIHCFQSPKAKINDDEKLVNYLAIREFNTKQLKLREAREQQQIQRGKTLLKSKKCRFLEENCQNLQLYQGSFNQCSKVSAVFRKTHKPFANRSKNSSSFSLLEKEREQIHMIKKYRFNSALNKKHTILRQPALNSKKASKTFTSGRPVDGAVAELETNLKVEKELIVRQEVSLSPDEGPLNLGPSAWREEKQNEGLEFGEFVELGNWQGQGLMSNPFDKKKPLKKGKKKST